MTDGDELAAKLLQVPAAPQRELRRKQHPAGWEPGVAWDPTTGSGELTVQLEDDPDPALWAELIADWGLDPSRCQVVPGSVQIRAWDANVGDGEVRRMRYYRATITGRTSGGDQADVAELCRKVMKRPGRARVAPPDTPRALVVALSDWQVGKGEGGGSQATVDRLLQCRDLVRARIRELAKAGRPVSTVYLVGLGDLVEGCRGHYESQTFTVDLDRTQQARVVRRLLLAYVDAVAELVPQVVLAAVPGNHGENRNGSGRAFTNVATDNDDLGTVEQVAEILAANPDRYGHVAVHLADDYTMALDVHGVVVAFTHGHTARNSGHAAQVLENWWRGQALGRRAVADADVLVAGHRHHLVVSESTGRTFLQAPAMDGGSHWFTSSSGNSSPPGVLTFAVGRDAYGERGWGDLAVLEPVELE